MRRLTDGVLHTKFWIVDKTHVYLGSANMDWRSLTQVNTSEGPGGLRPSWGATYACPFDCLFCWPAGAGAGRALSWD